ncbi:MAG: damage-control phosphatase ARMT1 family protein [Fusobacteriota bacterium]
MRTYVECIPCIINQGIKTAKRLNIDESTQQDMVRDILNYLKDKKYDSSPPEIAKPIYKIINRYVERNDPFKELKDFYNTEMLKLEKDLKDIIDSNRDIKTAVKLAITGNIIDFGAKHSFTKETVLDKVTQIEESTLNIDDSAKLQQQLKKSENLLYLGDNCGEIVFDKVFIEYLQEEFPNLDITYGVRGKPVINDITKKDAVEVGLNKIVKIIDNGDSAPGTVIKDASEEFKKVFYDADIVITKGQGNYETLNNIDRDNLFFLFMAKCNVVAEALEVPTMSLICKAK